MRLQGYSWYKIKNQFALESINISDKGNIRANLIHKRKGYKAYHWLSHEEAYTFTVTNKKIFEEFKARIIPMEK